MKRLVVILLFWATANLHGQTLFFLDSTNTGVRYLQAFGESSNSAFVHKIEIPYDTTEDPISLQTWHRKPAKKAFKSEGSRDLPLAYNSREEALRVYDAHFDRRVRNRFIAGGVLLGASALMAIPVFSTSTENQGAGYQALAVPLVIIPIGGVACLLSAQHLKKRAKGQRATLIGP